MTSRIVSGDPATEKMLGGVHCEDASTLKERSATVVLVGALCDWVSEYLFDINVIFSLVIGSLFVCLAFKLISKSRRKNLGGRARRNSFALAEGLAGYKNYDSGSDSGLSDEEEFDSDSDTLECVRDEDLESFSDDSDSEEYEERPRRYRKKGGKGRSRRRRR